jgi:hypothetical protein
MTSKIGNLIPDISHTFTNSSISPLVTVLWKSGTGSCVNKFAHRSRFTGFSGSCRTNFMSLKRKGSSEVGYRTCHIWSCAFCNIRHVLYPPGDACRLTCINMLLDACTDRQYQQDRNVWPTLSEVLRLWNTGTLFLLTCLIAAWHCPLK